MREFSHVCLQKGLDLRIEHTHCFSEHGEGGHYHYDVTPRDVHYHGFFSVAEEIYRVDAPVATHKVCNLSLCRTQKRALTLTFQSGTCT